MQNRKIAALIASLVIIIGVLSCLLYSNYREDATDERSQFAVSVDPEDSTPSTANDAHTPSTQTRKLEDYSGVSFGPHLLDAFRGMPEDHNLIYVNDVKDFNTDSEVVSAFSEDFSNVVFKVAQSEWDGIGVGDSVKITPTDFMNLGSYSVKFASKEACQYDTDMELGCFNYYYIETSTGNGFDVEVNTDEHAVFITPYDYSSACTAFLATCNVTNKDIYMKAFDKYLNGNNGYASSDPTDANGENNFNIATYDENNPGGCMIDTSKYDYEELCEGATNAAIQILQNNGYQSISIGNVVEANDKLVDGCIQFKWSVSNIDGVDRYLIMLADTTGNYPDLNSLYDKYDWVYFSYNF